MADRHPFEDQATLYVLGRLATEERQEFETRLAESAELRELVRELEDGTVALAMASTLRQPPSQVWRNIESAITKESKSSLLAALIGAQWWRSGWAAAAVCLTGWLLYAVWNHSPGSPTPLQPAITADDPNASEANPLQLRLGAANANPFVTTNPAPPATSESLLKAGQITALRLKVTDLRGQIEQLSHALTRQLSALSNSSQLTFFNLTPPGTESNAAALSPKLQNALLLALARELNLQQGYETTNGMALGMLKRGRVNFVTLPGASHENPTHPAVEDAAARTEATQSPATDSASSSHPADSTQASASANPPTDTPQPTSEVTISPTTAVTGFISGTSAIFAVDPSANSSLSGPLTVWTSGPNGYLSLGTFITGTDPVVATIPMGNLSADGLGFTLTTGTAANGVILSNIIGQFPSASPPH